MATSIIRVYNQGRGRPEANARVVLGWSGFVNLGQSKPVYTDRNGEAHIQHSATGPAVIYVNGREMDKFRSPGAHTVFV